MINPCSAEFFHNSPANLKSLQKTGIVAVIDAADLHSGNGEQLINAYICKIASTQTDSFHLWSSIFTEIDSERDCHAVFVRFSTRVCIPLKSSKIAIRQSKNDEISVSSKNENEDCNEAIIEDLCCNLEHTFGSTVKVKPMYYINDIAHRRAYPGNKSELQMEKYCVAIPINGNRSGHSNELKGCVAYLFNSIDHTTGEATFKIPIVPIPLLSIAILPLIDINTKESNEVGEKSNTKLIFLQMCLKRQLVGSIVTIPNDSSLHHKENGISTENDSQCIVTLFIPGVNGDRTMQSYRFRIINAVPPQNYTKSRREGYQSLQSTFFCVLPSTRVTLLPNHETVTNHSKRPILKDHRNDDAVKKVVEDINQNSRRNPNAQKIILDTINVIRFFSRNFSGKKHSMPSQNVSSCKTDYKMFSNGGFDIPRAFLLVGPPGVGKTYAVRAVQEKSMVESTRLISIRGSELLSSGSTEADAAVALQRIFATCIAFTSKREENVSILFLDECDALLSSIVTSSSLANLLDKMSCYLDDGTVDKCVGLSDLSPTACAWKRIIVVAGTNRIDAIPAALRRPGRFDREIYIGPPNSQERYAILKSLLGQFEELEKRSFKKDESDFSKSTFQRTERENSNIHSRATLLDEHSLTSIADSCVGYVASDLAALVRRAAYLAIEDGASVIKSLSSAMIDVKASALRESAVNAPPPTRWDDIAGDAGGAKTALRRAIEWPQTKSKQFARLGLLPPRGILLHGPPGCGACKHYFYVLLYFVKFTSFIILAIVNRQN